MIRLGNSTEVRLSQLEFKQYQVQIAAGTTTFRVLRDNDAQVEISTPTVSVRPVRAGTYRISVRPDGITEITVRGGEAEIYGPRGSETLAQGQTMQARGSADDPEFQIIAAIPLDDFDRFNTDRDQAMQQTASYRPGYVPPDEAGGEALDPYGQWQNDPNYGQVWVPIGAAGLGSVSERALGGRGLLRLDLGERGSVGLGPVSLRRLVHGSLGLGLVAGRDRPALLAAGDGGILRMGRRRDLAWASDSASASDTWAGCRWVRMRRSIPGMAREQWRAAASGGRAWASRTHSATPV